MAKSYLEELVYAEAEDGVLLAGLVIHPITDAPKPIAVVWISGFSINFYHPSFVPIGRALAGLGYVFVIGNHRGHDIGANLWAKHHGGEGMLRTYGGAWWERFEDSPRDVAAWITLTMTLGVQGIVLVGHSFGAPKVVYYQAQQQDPRVRGLVVASTRVEPYECEPDLVALAEQMVAAGRGEELLPWGTLQSFFTGTLSAQTYLSRARMPDLYGVSTAGSAISQIRCPLFVCYGTDEGEDPTENLALIRRNATGARSVETRLFAGANHGYDHHEREVAEAMNEWIGTLG